MRRSKTCFVLVIGTATCLGITNLGCKSMQGGPLQKMAFWKKDAPPKSELAERLPDRVQKPSETTAVFSDATQKSDITSPSLAPEPGPSAFSPASTQVAANGSQAPSAFGRKPYPSEPPSNTSSLNTLAPAFKTASGVESNTFAQTDFPKTAAPAFQPLKTPPLQETKNELVAMNSQFVLPSQRNPNFKQTGANQFEPRTPALKTPAFGSNSPVSPASHSTPNATARTTQTYPSTRFSAFQTRASVASHEMDLDEPVGSKISQAASIEPVKTILPPSLPVSALNRTGSYAPGSTGTATKGVCPAAFDKSFSTPANPACKQGCTCSGCKSSSGPSGFSNGGSFQLN